MKRICALFCALLLLAGCSANVPEQDDTFTITATTYPIYLFARTLTQGMENVRVERLDTGSVSCLHDYILSVSDVKKIEQADVIALNGVGLEDFLYNTSISSNAYVIDCSEGIELLPALGHHDHDHSDADHSHFDPHYWLDPLCAQTMLDTLCAGLCWGLPEQESLLTSNADLARRQLELGRDSALYMLGKEPLTIPGLITFHDGFQYFAHALDLPLLHTIEEEAGSETSAKEITYVSNLVKEDQIPVIFTEVNGSDATAKAIARETGCQVAQLSMIMDGPEPSGDDYPLDLYTNLFLHNVDVLINGFAGQEVLTTS